MNTSASNTPLTNSVKVIHFTRTINVDDPLQVGFSVLTADGQEQMNIANCPNAYSLYQLFLDKGWITSATRRGRPAGIHKVRGRRSTKNQATAAAA